MIDGSLSRSPPPEKRRKTNTKKAFNQGTTRGEEKLEIYVLKLNLRRRMSAWNFHFEASH